MRHLICTVLEAALLAGAAHAQPAQSSAGSGSARTKDWNAVLALSEGDEITVTSARTGTLRCQFVSATETALYCDMPGPIPLSRIGDRPYAFTRDEIVKVRRRHFSRDRNITIAAFAAIGCAIGATGGGGPPGCLLGGVAFGVVGAVAAVIVFYWLPGNTIYENPAAHPPTAKPQQVSGDPSALTFAPAS
jgi:hypothetical protein